MEKEPCDMPTPTNNSFENEEEVSDTISDEDKNENLQECRNLIATDFNVTINFIIYPFILLIINSVPMRMSRTQSMEIFLLTRFVYKLSILRSFRD